MKIAEVITRYPPANSGAGMLVSAIAQELSKYHEVGVFCGEKDKNKPVYEMTRYLHDGVSVTKINLYPFYNPGLIENYHNPSVDQYFEQFLNELQPDIVHFHAVQALGANIIALAQRKGIKTVVTMHDWWWKCPQLFMMYNGGKCESPFQNCSCSTHSFLKDRENYLAPIKQGIDLVLTPSDFLMNSLNGFKIYNGIIHNNENGIFIEKPQGFKKKSSKLLRFGFFGGQTDVKGYKYIIEAAEKIERNDFIIKMFGFPVCVPEPLPPSINLLTKVKKEFKLIDARSKSQGIAKALYASWKRLIEIIFDCRPVGQNQHLNDTTNKIQFFPRYSSEDLPQIYEEIDVVLAPSIIESFSLVVREAAVFETPVVTTNCGGVENFILDNENGLVLKKITAEDLAEKMSLCADRKILDHLIKGMQKTSKTIRSVSQQVKELENYFLNI